MKNTLDMTLAEGHDHATALSVAVLFPLHKIRLGEGERRAFAKTSCLVLVTNICCNWEENSSKLCCSNNTCSWSLLSTCHTNCTPLDHFEHL